MLLGNPNAWGKQVVSRDRTKHTYDPKLYFSNTLNKTFKIKE